MSVGPSVCTTRPWLRGVFAAVVGEKRSDMTEGGVTLLGARPYNEIYEVRRSSVLWSRDLWQSMQRLGDGLGSSWLAEFESPPPLYDSKTSRLREREGSGARRLVRADRA